jgi:hypothetical protein
VRAASRANAVPAESIVIVFQCYLDDSGTSGLPVVTMAGFVATISQWEIIEPALNEILGRYGVPVLHTKEFNDTKGPFKGWSKIKKQTLVQEMFEAAHGRMYGVSMTVRKERFVQQKREKNIMHSTSAYGGCFTAILFHLAVNPQIGPVIRKDGLAFVVESGNKNNAEVEQLFHSWAGRKNFEGMLRSIVFVPKEALARFKWQTSSLTSVGAI